MQKDTLLITGASRGLGRALALSLKDSYHIISGVRDLNTAPPNTTPLALDLADHQSIDQAAATLLSSPHSPDIIIHNAAICPVGPVDSLTPDETQNLFQINVLGPIKLTQLLLPPMRTRKKGKIVFISSVRAVDGGAYIGLYAASKAALEAAALDWAITLTPWNIGVTIVQPGPMDSGITFPRGSYFKDATNPYPPLGEISLDCQPLDEVCKFFKKHLQEETPPFKTQTNQITTDTVQQHLKDPTGNKWKSEQVEWYTQLLKEN